MRLGNRELRVALIVATGFIGCADGTPSSPRERVGEASQDWSVTSCDDSVQTPHAAFDVEVSPAHESPQSYNLCLKSYLVELNHYAELGAGGDSGMGAESHPPLGGGEGGAPLTHPHLLVAWNDQLPTTEAECVASLVGGILYYRGQANGEAAWVPLTGQVTQYGSWRSLPGPGNGRCRFAEVVFEPLVPGHTYRVAATARNSANETRKIRIETGP